MTLATATLILVGIVPNILKTYIENNKLVIQHNFPIDIPQSCVVVSNTKMICDKLDVTIVTVE